MKNTKQLDALFEKIRNIDNKEVLEEIHRLLEVDFDDSVYPLNEHQEAEIAQARKEIGRGEGISSERIENEFDEWLNK